jgi:hypothetical protein
MTTWMAAGAVAAIAIIFVMLGTLLWVRLSGYRRAPARGCGTTGESGLTPLGPMARLLAEEDLDFLRRYEKCRPRLAARWERDRRRIFRLYLREAAADFHRMHAQARLLVADAPEQHADLVGVLMRQQATFWRTLMLIELRLAFSGLGLGKLDSGKIAASLEAMRADLNRSMAAASA